MKPSSIDVSVVTGSDPAMILRCLRTFHECYAHWSGRVRIHVTVNGGDEELAERVRDVCHNAIIRVNPVPRGFAANHNAVVLRSDADYIMILNDDLEFRDASLDNLLSFMDSERQSGIGVATPMLLNPDGTVQPCTYSFPSVGRALFALSGIRDLVGFNAVAIRIAGWFGYGEGRSRLWAHDRSCGVETFRGACMLVRGAAARAVGAMSETSLVGGEETEWHYRLRRAGWGAYFFHEARVVHYGGQTVSRNPLLAEEYFKGLLYFFNAHESLLRRVLFRWGAYVVLWVKYARATFMNMKNERTIARRCLKVL